VAEAGTVPAAAPVVVCYPFAGDMLGGSHHSVLGLLRGLDRQAFQPLVVLEEPNGRLAKHFAAFDIAADPCPPQRSFAVGQSFGLAKFLRALTGIPRRARFLRQHGVTIVHTNDGRSHATWALAARLAGARVLWHHRGDPNARGLRWLAPLVADRIAAVSRFALPRRRQSRVAREAQVVFSPFDTAIQVDRAAQRGKLLAELGLPDNAVLCGYFGLFNPRKRPVAFVDAVCRLRQIADRPVAGLLFGEAEDPQTERAIHDRLARPDCGETVRLMGYRSPGAEWIGGCDLLLVSAIDEPLGRTLVEAMLVGTPVVATRSGGNPEAVLDGMGLLVTPDHAEAMAQAAAQLIGDAAACAKMVARARTSALERFGAERHVAAISAIYRELS
jgi:glycosyltransferase involved in cell wall biosynthesis